AMSMRYIGETLDIHGGGMENQFPHHESEIAQSEAANEKPFVRYWIHHNMVTVNGQKMGKSLGNFVTLKDAFQDHDPQVIRFALLRTHYRSPMDYSEEALHAAKSGYDRLKTAYEALKRLKPVQESEAKGTEKTLGDLVAKAETDFKAALDDDLNSPRALATAFDLTSEINTLLADSPAFSAPELNQALDFYEKSLGEVLGIHLASGRGASENLEAQLVEFLISLRKSFRTEKLWAQADQVRDGLAALGITLKDSKEETIWSKS
ncbi:MAG: class I tRNA ligase family protein, partial [Planctomycetes bacterium]|nr:class I tRNA ligase family protein [Planctomycetota bacterium]